MKKISKTYILGIVLSVIGIAFIILLIPILIITGIRVCQSIYYDDGILKNIIEFIISVVVMIGAVICTDYGLEIENRNNPFED